VNHRSRYLNLFPISTVGWEQSVAEFAKVILPVVVYECETWSLTWREERKLRVFENMVLRRIFGPRRDEVMGE